MVEFRTLLWGWLALMPVVTVAQEVRHEMEVTGMEGRAYRWSEVLPLTGVAVPVDSGSVTLEGRVTLRWPDDGRVHTYRLECAGVEWTLPVCGPAQEGHRLVSPTAAGAPFSARPGAVLAEVGAAPWLPLVSAELDAAIEEIEAGLEVEWQRALLWGTSARRGGESEALGSAIESGPAEAVAADSLRVAWMAALTALEDTALEGQPALVRSWLAVRLNAVRTEVDSEAREAAHRAWQAMPAPDPTDPAAVQQFAEGADRFATVVALPDTLAEAYARGLGLADWESLVEAGAGWWGQPDADKTAAWCAHRLGRDAFGVRRPGVPFAARSWTPAWQDLLQRLEGHSLYGAEIGAWLRADAPAQALPKRLRAMDVAQSPVAMEDIVGSGPAVWLWLDAGAPSTTVQLQVLERMMADPMAKRWPRGLQWVVADAGTDWPAFQALVRQLAERFGGLSRLPFTLVHTGGDLRWTQAFELAALPAVRHHGANGIPVAAEPPLPGPELSRWLAKRP